MKAATDQLSAALTGVNWNQNVKVFLQDPDSLKAISACNYRLALWSREFEVIEEGNAALPFIRAMQTAGHHVAALASLALYGVAAGSVREVLETALYYTYFRSHPVELATLATRTNYFITKQDVLDYHRLHTRRFAECERRLGLVARLNDWYRSISAIVHGQVPGVWVVHANLDEIRHSQPTLAALIGHFREAEELVNRLFLCTAGRDLWHDVRSSAKMQLLKGLTGDDKTTLQLDSA